MSAATLLTYHCSYITQADLTVLFKVSDCSIRVSRSLATLKRTGIPASVQGLGAEHIYALHHRCSYDLPLLPHPLPFGVIATPIM